MVTIGEISDALHLVLDVTDGLEQRISALTLRVDEAMLPSEEVAILRRHNIALEQRISELSVRIEALELAELEAIEFGELDADETV